MKLWTYKDKNKCKVLDRKADRLLGLKKYKIKIQKKLIKYKGKIGYRKYLKTKHWKTFRNNYFKRNRNICYCCNEFGYELHHIRYDNLFRETDKDVVCLCRKCHEKIHTLILNEKEFKLKNAHKYYKKLLYYLY